MAPEKRDQLHNRLLCELLGRDDQSFGSGTKLGSIPFFAPV